MSNQLWYRLKKVWPVYPGFLRPACPPQLDAFYRNARRRRWRLKTAVDGALWLALYSLAPLRARRVARRLGLQADWVRRAAAIARGRFIDPHDVAIFGIKSATHSDDFVRRFEYAHIIRPINPRITAPDCALADKVLFAERCAAHGVPHAPLIAWRRGGEVYVRGDPDGRDMFVKPIGGTASKGVAVLPAPDVAPDARWFADHVPLRRNWLVQKRLRAHPDLAGLTRASMPNLRLTTFLNEQDAPEPVTFVMRLPLDLDRITSNRGLVCEVDPATGALNSGARMRPDGDVLTRFAVHPTSGARIEGLRLPDWEQAVAAAVKAHGAAFPDYTMIGWDVVFTDTGPILLEGNGKPAISFPQRFGTGIWATRLGELIAWRLDRRFS